MATFSSLVNFCVGFGSITVKGKKKVNKRKQIQAASKKANRTVRKKSLKHYPQCSLEVRRTQLIKTAWQAKVEFYKVKLRPKHVLAEKPILKKALPALERPTGKVVVVRKEAAKQPALPSIIGALKASKTHKPYVGKKRTTVGKKYKTPTNKVRKSKSEAKKVSGKKCLHAKFLDLAPSGNYKKLNELANLLGYTVVSNNSIAAIGWINFETKIIVLNTGGDLVEYVLFLLVFHSPYTLA